MEEARVATAQITNAEGAAESATAAWPPSALNVEARGARVDERDVSPLREIEAVEFGFLRRVEQFVGEDDERLDLVHRHAGLDERVGVQLELTEVEVGEPVEAEIAAAAHHAERARRMIYTGHGV